MRSNGRPTGAHRAAGARGGGGPLNSGFEYRERLGGAASGSTLIGYLARRYAHSSETEWRARIDAGRVLLDGLPAPADSPLREGQTLCWRRPPWREPDAPRTFEVVHEDAHLLAVAKPAGLPVVAGGGFLENTLAALVRRHAPDAAPMHRLGRWTSGLVLFGRTGRARASLARAWRQGAVLKEYRALALGDPLAEEFTVEVPIGPVPHASLGSLHAACPAGKASRTRVRVLERRGGAFLARVIIATGRPHQIRIHLAAAGHPLAGDPMYGPGGVPPEGCTAVPGDPGYALHALRLRFEHPVGGRRVDLRTPPPPSLRLRGE